jgi:hypothetical protein
MSRKDYYVSVVDRTHVEVKLAADAWMPAGKSGDLKVVAVDTGAGKVTTTITTDDTAFTITTTTTLLVAVAKLRLVDAAFTSISAQSLC